MATNPTPESLTRQIGWVRDGLGATGRDGTGFAFSAHAPIYPWEGDPQAASQLLPLVYDELRLLAAHKLRQEKPGRTLQPTALAGGRRSFAGMPWSGPPTVVADGILALATPAGGDLHFIARSTGREWTRTTSETPCDCSPRRSSSVRMGQSRRASAGDRPGGRRPSGGPLQKRCARTDIAQNGDIFRPRVLIVDDAEDVRKLLGMMLQSGGIDVVAEASTARKAPSSHSSRTSTASSWISRMPVGRDRGDASDQRAQAQRARVRVHRRRQP
jgi:hypothetical protein